MPRAWVLALLLGAPAAPAQTFPEFADARLQSGRAVWLGTCQACHADDVAGAPLVTDKTAWAPRLAQGRAVLYESALRGRVGPKGTEMPARGGNAALTDDEVKSAVDYMTAVVAQ